MSSLFKDTPFDLTGRSALVTGAGRGLGKEMARILARAGAEVAICSRTESQIKASASELAKEAGVRVEPIVADVGKRLDAERLAREAVARLGKIDILVSNAGWNIPQPVESIRDEDWDALVELNVTSSMVLTRALAPGMKDRKWGRIIYTSSVMALASTGDRVAYSTTKAALHGMVKANALRLGPFGVTVNCLAPGPFATEMPMTILSEQQKKSFASRTALERWGEPLHTFPAFTASVANLQPTSRGHIRLKSPDPADAPAIQPNYLSTDEDRRVAADSIRVTRRIVAQPALQAFHPVEYLPGESVGNDDTSLAKAAGDVGTTIFHPVGTAKMGRDTDPLAVVDERLRVFGLDGIRVVDASVMPTITSGNTNSPTIMIAEKGAAMIREDTRR